MASSRLKRYRNGRVTMRHPSRDPMSRDSESRNDPCPAPAERQRRSEGGSAVQNDLAHTLGPVQASNVTKARTTSVARRPRTRGTPSEAPQSPPGSSIPESPRSRRLQGMGEAGLRTPLAHLRIHPARPLNQDQKEAAQVVSSQRHRRNLRGWPRGRAPVHRGVGGYRTAGQRITRN